MVSTKCCAGIIIGVLVAVGVAVGIYFGAVAGMPRSASKQNHIKSVQVLLKTNHSILVYNLVNKKYYEMANTNKVMNDIIHSFDYYINRTIFYASSDYENLIKSAIPDEQFSLLAYPNYWNPTCMAVDQLTGKIYVGDSDRGTIFVFDVFRGYYNELITRLDEPIDIVLYHAQRSMFVLTKSSIISATMSGVNVRELINKPDLRAMAIEFTNDRLYYAAGDTIVMHDLKTSKETVGFTLEVTSLAVQNRELFLISKKDNNLYTCWDPQNSTSCQLEEVVPREVEPLNSVKTYGHLASIKGASSPCDKNNGGCQHLCLLAPNEEGYVCGCNYGLTLNPDKKNCIMA